MGVPTAEVLTESRADTLLRRPRPLAGTAWVPKALVALAVLALALWPRLLDLDVFVTTDEVLWVGRTGNFAAALAERRLDLTYQSGHPGVATMWAGLLGMGLEQAEAFGKPQRRVSRIEVGRQPHFIGALAAGRSVVAVTTAAVVAGLTLLTWRLLGPLPALVGGVLLALDPFLLAHSRVLHTDALLTSFMALALLAGLVRWLGGGGRAYLLLAGPATGLALLSKAPALFLLGFLPAVALLAAWRRGCLLRWQLWLDLACWAGLAGLTYLALWPALWVAPLDTLRAVVSFIGNNADPRYAPVAVESERGAAYFGAESGALFYPAAFALRTTPLVLIGLAWLVIEGLITRADSRGMARSRVPLALTGYAVLFGLAITLAGKSFDRYLLPAFPALDLMAGLGLVLAARRLGRPGPASLAAAVAALALAAWPVVSSRPYGLTWYNPLFGGGPMAQRMLTVGWGEGLDRVAAYLNGKPNAAGLRVGMPAGELTAELYGAALSAQFVGQVVPLDGGDPSAGGVDYLVTYGPLPRDAEPRFYDPRFQDWRPEFSLRLADVEYGRVYAAGRGIPIGATFGRVVLEGYGVDAPSVRAGRPLEARLFWRDAGAAPSEARVILSLTRSEGGEVARVEAPLGASGTGPAEGRTYRLGVPNRTEPGEYLLWVWLESASGSPVPLAGRPAALAIGAPERPDRAVLRSIRVR